MDSATLDQRPAERPLIALGRLVAANTLVNFFAHRTRCYRERAAWTGGGYIAPMILVGLTGGIGSGKSTVSALLSARGAHIIDADAVTRDVQQPGRPVIEAIAARFGDKVIDDGGGLRRAELAEIVFGPSMVTLVDVRAGLATLTLQPENWNVESEGETDTDTGVPAA